MIISGLSTTKVIFQVLKFSRNKSRTSEEAWEPWWNYPSDGTVNKIPMWLTNQLHLQPLFPFLRSNNF